MTHYNVQFNSAIPELGTVGSPEQERFQGTLENRRGTHQLEFCWEAVTCSGRQQKTPSRRISDGSWERRSRRLKSRSWWDISNCSQHASQVGWRLVNSCFVTSFSGFRRRSNLELSTGTHRLSSHVAVLQASLENVFTANFTFCLQHFSGPCSDFGH